MAEALTIELYVITYWRLHNLSRKCYQLHIPLFDGKTFCHVIIYHKTFIGEIA